MNRDKISRIRAGADQKAKDLLDLMESALEVVVGSGSSYAIAAAERMRAVFTADILAEKTETYQRAARLERRALAAPKRRAAMQRSGRVSALRSKWV